MNAARMPSTAMSDSLTTDASLPKRCSSGVYNMVRRCSASLAGRIGGFNPHSSRNIYKDCVSSMVKQTNIPAKDWEKDHDSAHKIFP